MPLSVSRWANAVRLAPATAIIKTKPENITFFIAFSFAQTDQTIAGRHPKSYLPRG
jgi:hypothetical protein